MSEAAVVPGQEERHANLPDQVPERLGVAKVHLPHRSPDLDRDSLEYAGSELVADRSTRDLDQTVPDEVSPIVSRELTEGLRDLSIDRRALAVHLVDEASVTKRHRLDRAWSCARNPHRGRERRRIGNENAGIPATAIELEEAAVNDRLAIQVLDRRLGADPGQVECRDVSPLLELGPDHPFQLGDAWEQKESRPAQAVPSFKPVVRGSSLHFSGESGGVDLFLVLELEEEAVTPLAWKLRRERHRLQVPRTCGLVMLAGMHV